MMAASSDTVPYWGFYGTQNYFDTNPNDSAAGRAFLDGLRKLDPNATFVQTTMGESGSPVWRLQTSVQFPGVDLNAGAYNPQYDPNGTDPSASHNFDTSQLKNPNDTRQSGTFGAYTPWSNLKPQAPTLLDYLGPAAVGAFGLMMGGIPALYQGVFGQGAYGAGAGAASGAASGAADLTGFQIPGGASGAFNAAVGGGAPAASLPGFQIPGGAGGLFGVAGSGIDPSTAAILTDINSPSLFDVGPVFDQAIADGVASGAAGGAGGAGSAVSNALGKIPQIANALGKIPGIGGGTGAGGGSGGGGGGGGLLQPYNMQPYKSLTSILRNYGLLGMPNG